LSIEVAIVTFGGQVKTVQDFVGIQTFQPHTLQRHKDSEIRYFRPWIFLITDGAPTDHWQTAA